MTDYVGRTLGPYKLEMALGKGGMATVYRAYQTSVKRYVAIKVMAPEIADQPGFVERFEREAEVIAALEHPHILPIIDYGNADGIHYLVMRYIEGGSLDDRMRRKALSIKECARLLEQMASALDYAHQRGVIHRDLKPNNVLLDANENAYLTDFGIARMTQSEHKLTATGSIMGTPAYMSPEQGMGRPVDARSDLYTLGIVLYEMVLNRLPFSADTPAALIFQHVYEQPAPPQQIKPDLPDAIANVLNKAMAKSPDDRYQSGAEMSEAFAEAVANRGTRRDTPQPGEEGTIVGGPMAPIPSTPSGRPPTVGTPQQPQMSGPTIPPTVPPAPPAVTSGTPAAPTAGSSSTSAGVGPTKKGLPLTLIAAVVVILLLIGGGGFLFISSQNANQTATAVAIALAGTSTADANSTETAVALSNSNATGTAVANATGTAAAVIAMAETSTADANATSTAIRIIALSATKTPTPTRTPTNTATFTATPTATFTASATLTPSFTPTPNATLTQLANQLATVNAFNAGETATTIANVFSTASARTAIAGTRIVQATQTRETQIEATAEMQRRLTVTAEYQAIGATASADTARMLTATAAASMTAAVNQTATAKSFTATPTRTLPPTRTQTPRPIATRTKAPPTATPTITGYNGPPEAVIAKLQRDRVLTGVSGSVAYKKDALDILVRNADSTTWNTIDPNAKPTDFVIAAEVQWSAPDEANECGFVFRYNQPGDKDYTFYVATISRHGTYQAGAYDHDQWRNPLITQKASSLIQTDDEATNHILLIGRGN
ncbi:MAG: protein kinase, partial [Anaerolineae bacterium]|nr:protein kinase [Anaerolineae bacterium]